MKLQRKNRRALTLGALAVSGALVLTACGSDDTGTKTGGGGSQPTAAASSIKCDDAKGQLLAAGSSAQKNAIDAWVKNFTAGLLRRRRSTTRAPAPARASPPSRRAQVAFAGSDSALKPDEVAASKKVCTGGQGIDLPMVGGPIAVGYNVPGVDNLVAGRAHPRQDLQRQDHQLERPGDHEAEPGREAAQHRRSRRSTARTTPAPRTTSPST